MDKLIKQFWKRNSSTILTCAGGVGVVVTAVVTAKATIKVMDILEEAEEEKGDKLTTMEKVVLATPSYLPAILIAGATIGCGVSAHLLNKKRQTALIGAYALLDQSYQKYRHSVENRYGIEVDEEIRAEISSVTPVENNDKELFYEVLSETYFESTIADVYAAQYEANRALVVRDYLYLYEWYAELGIEVDPEKYDSGWSTGMCMDMYWQTWLDFGHKKMINADGQEYTAIWVYQEPIEGFETYDY